MTIIPGEEEARLQLRFRALAVNQIAIIKFLKGICRDPKNQDLLQDMQAVAEMIKTGPPTEESVS